MQALFQRRKKWTSTERFYVAFSTAMLCLITIYMSTEAVFGQEMWVVNADFPGGAAGWFFENVNVWYQTLGTASSVLLNMLSDALLVSTQRSARVFVTNMSFLDADLPCLRHLD